MATSDNEELTRKEGEPATGKRKEPPHQDEGDSGDGSPDEKGPSLHDLSRSEKKRNREKKRREDVNHGFDQLMSLIFMIDPELKAEAEDRQRNSLGDASKVKAEAPLLSRIELINAAYATLKRVHDENEKRKMTIALLSKGLLYPKNGGVGPSLPIMPPLSPYVYPQNMARPPSMQNHRGLHPQLNIAALLADPVAGTALRETLRNASHFGHLQETFSTFAPSQRGPAPENALPPNHQSLEAILSGIQNAAPPAVSLEAILGGRQNNPLGPPVLDTMALVRELQQDRSRGDPVYNHQQGILNPELSAAQLHSLLGQSGAPPPGLPHGSDIGALLQLLSNEQIQQAVRRNERS